MNHTPPTDTRLDDIAARAAAATKGPWGFYDGDNYADVAADLTMTSRASYSYREKIARLEDENYWDDPAHEDDDEQRASEQMAANAAFIAHAREDVPLLLAEVYRQRAELAEMRATIERLRELERPAIELKRNEIRLSYRQLAVQAREDRDYEGEATVLKQLADHEEQWKREDAAASDAPSAPVSVAVSAPQASSARRDAP